MISIDLIKNDPERVERAIEKRGMKIDFSNLLKMDSERRTILSEVDELKAKRNNESAKVPMLKKEGKDCSAIFAEMKELGEKIEELDGKVAELETKIFEFLAPIPNLVDEDVVAGGKEANVELRSFGKKPEFSFTPRSHIDLCKINGFIDYERGAKIAGNGSWVYTGEGAELEWAILNFFVSEHLADGYKFMLPPHMLGYECGFVAGQFPKFDGEVYWLDEKSKTGRFLLPTAETPLANLYRGEIIPEDQLPIKMFAYTPCYRREAGSYRSEERGMIRGHQFNKVEMFQITSPNGSDEAFNELVGKAENLVKKLGLHFRTSKLAAEDVSATMARTYDVEIWIPSMGIYKEVSSASNARDYQARRGNIRFRNNETKKTEFVHTLNASGLATSRLFPAILEQYQNEDGTITVPEVLRPFMRGKTIIGKGVNG
ncbi:MAG: serine--tRNA ligase [Christensenellales bacterium]